MIVDRVPDSGRRRWPARSRPACARTGRPFSSSTRPETTMRSPIGSPSCWRVRSLSSGLTSSWPKSGPVTSDSVCGSRTSGCARRALDRRRDRADKDTRGCVPESGADSRRAAQRACRDSAVVRHASPSPVSDALDDHRDALPDADAHRAQRVAAAAAAAAGRARSSPAARRSRRADGRARSRRRSD